MTEPITTERLKEQVAKLEYEKPRIVQWGHYDEERLVVYRELLALRARVEAAEKALALEKAASERMRKALVRLRDCDWTISLPDRMDAVRGIARAALAPREPGPSGTSEG